MHDKRSKNKLSLIGSIVTYNEAAAYLRIDLFPNKKAIADICLMAEIVWRRTEKLTGNILYFSISENKVKW